MEENLPAAISQDNPNCIECGHQLAIHGYPTPLCSDCRTKFIKYPVPKWIGVFALVVFGLFSVSLYKLPRQISTAVHLEKGKNAVAQKKFITAEKELSLAYAAEPGHKETRAYRMLAALANQDMITFSNMFRLLQNETIDDAELFGKLSNCVDEAANYYPSDGIIAIIYRYDSSISKVPLDTLKRFVQDNPADIYGLSAYVSLLNEHEDYVHSDSVLSVILQMNSGQMGALQQMAMVKRMENQLDSSLIYCDKILALNQECTYALASKCRTLLKMNQNKAALKLAKQAMQLNDSDPYATASLFLAYHFMKMEKEKAAMLKKMSANTDPDSHMVFQYALDVASGKEPF